MSYKLALNNEEIAEYIGSKKLLALDIETSPKVKYREEEKASLVEKPVLKDDDRDRKE